MDCMKAFSVADEEREGMTLADEVEGGTDGDETLRCWDGFWVLELLLVLRCVADGFPATVCRKVRDGMDDVREVLDAGIEGDLLLSAPRTSFNEIFGLLEATCHGDEGVSSRILLSIDGVKLTSWWCC